MEKVEVTYGKTVLVWWSYFWRTALYTVIAAVGLGILNALTLGRFVEPTLGLTVAVILDVLAGFLLSIWVLKNMLSKKYKTFSVVLIKEDSD